MNAAEKRQYPRKDVFTAALIALNDLGFLSEVWDLSRGGARVGMPRGWTEKSGVAVRVYFLLDHDNVISVSGRVVRVGDDHLGLQFDGGQQERIEALLYESRFLDSQAPG